MTLDPKTAARLFLRLSRAAEELRAAVAEAEEAGYEYTEEHKKALTMADDFSAFISYDVEAEVTFDAELARLRADDKTDPHVLRVFGNDGGTYIYGVFADRASAIEFGQKECPGHRWESQRLIVVER